MKKILAVGAAFALASIASKASAAESDFAKKHESSQWFAFELRFAPYWPDIDSQPSLGGAQPYHKTFGNMARLLVSGEIDAQVLQIPHFGSLGPAFSFGYTQMSAPAPLSNGSGLSAENTNLEVFPMYLVAVLRVDVLLARLPRPVRPVREGRRRLHAVAIVHRLGHVELRRPDHRQDLERLRRHVGRTDRARRRVQPRLDRSPRRRAARRLHEHQPHLHCSASGCSRTSTTSVQPTACASERTRSAAVWPSSSDSNFREWFSRSPRLHRRTTAREKIGEGRLPRP